MTYKVFQEIIRQEGLKNIIFSPLSMEFFAVMLLVSTTGKAQQQIMELLNITENELVEYKEKALVMMQQIEKKQLNVSLKTANSFWFNQKFEIKPAYINALKSDFNADVFSLDTNERQVTLQKINNWVSEATNNFIRNISLQIDERTLAVMINTLYFKANWYQKLEQEKRWLEPFYRLDGTSKNILYLYKLDSRQKIQYLQALDFHAISIPYLNEDFCMEIYLPFDKQGLPQFIARLPELGIANMSSKFAPVHDIHIRIPSFDFEQEIELNDICKKLGVDRIFELSHDFSPILDFKDGIAISKIAQKARIKVDKQGTEAAAVTYSTMIAGAMPSPQKIEEPIRFVADSPFLFLIRNRKENVILFMGILTEPDDYIPPPRKEEPAPKKDFWYYVNRFFGIEDK